MVRVGMQLLGAKDVIDTFRYLIGKVQAPAEWVVGTNVEYSVYVEFGTTRQAAQPYFRPAVAKAQRNLKAIVAKASGLDEALAEIARTIEAEAKRLVPVDTGTLRASIKAVKA